MASRAFVTGIMVGALLALVAAWLLWGARRTEQRRPAADTVRDAASADALPVPRADPRQLAAADATPGAPAAVVSRAASAARPTTRPESSLRPEDGPDGAAWRKAKLAFGMRELGKMGPYVKVALDAALREMEFCFNNQSAVPRAAAPDSEADAPLPAADPAVLLLYLQAREGALDIVDARTDHLGAASREVVDCCREVLRGWEIPAFRAVPGQRFRVKFELP